jgi:hypothetical protein
MNLKEKIENWYEGEFVAYENDPNSSVVIIGGSYERHWTANIARSFIAFYLSHWKWLWGFMATVSSLYVAYLKL